MKTFECCEMNLASVEFGCNPFDCIEDIEHKFGIEFSCGDGLYLSDIESDESMLEEYDGAVDYREFRKDGLSMMSHFYVLAWEENTQFGINGHPRFRNFKVKRRRW